MSSNLANGIAVAVVVAASVASALLFGAPVERARVGAVRMVAGSEVVEQDGVRGLVDASGRFVPLRDYRRILSSSTVADSLLLALAERSRIVAISRVADPDAPLGYERAGIPQLPPVSDVEKVLALHADLMLVNNFDRIEQLQQMREAGLEVFDLGDMRGLETLLPNIRTVATLLGRPERGVELARRFERRMRSIAAGLPDEERVSALYLGVHGDKLYGGTRGTSFHDVLTAAGLRDVAAARFEGWPRYTAEQLLLLDPELIVTQTGMSRDLCAQTGLSQMRPCRGQGRIVELAPELILMAGLNMLEAAEALHEAVYGQAGERGAPRSE